MSMPDLPGSSLVDGLFGNANEMTTIALGAHLHFEVRKDALKKCGGLDNRVDPLLFIQNCTNP